MGSLNYCKNEQGIALLELLLVLGLLGAIFSFCAFFNSSSRNFFSFAADRDAVLGALRRARALALNRVCAGAGCAAAKSHGVRFDPAGKECVIFQGADFAARDAALDEVVEFENYAVYLDLAAPVEVVFAVPFGQSATSTIVLKDDFGRQAEILVGQNGIIDWK